MAENSSDELLTEEAPVEGDAAGEETTPQRMNLEIRLESPSTCERHVSVTISAEDIQRYFDKAFTEMMPTVAVPGFRSGRAPRKLVEQRYRKDLADQVKNSLLMDSMAQATEDSKLTAINEPVLDPSAVKIPDEGPLTYEFDIEVRPEFDLPNWKGLTVERPTKTFTDKDIQARLGELLSKYGRLVPHDGAAEAGDYVVCNMTFKHGDDVLATSEEETIRIRPVLSFRDAKIENFDKVMVGVKADETRTAEAKLTADAPNEALRGKTVNAEFKVLEVKKLRLPELTPGFLEEIGVESEEELRQLVSEDLNRKLAYHQQQQARQQVTAQLTRNANWELPPGLLRRQAHRELERAVLELRRAGFSDSEIQAHENELRQNSTISTARALKEHFILERIAEDEQIDAEPDDYTNEVELIAQQTEQSPRRVRARLEKAGMMDALRNQIVERKVIDRVLESANFKDVPYEPAPVTAEAIDRAAGGEDRDAEIPEAKFPNAPAATPGSPAATMPKE